MDSPNLHSGKLISLQQKYSQLQVGGWKPFLWQITIIVCISGNWRLHSKGSIANVGSKLSSLLISRNLLSPPWDDCASWVLFALSIKSNWINHLLLRWSRPTRDIPRETNCAFWSGPGGYADLHCPRRTTARGNYHVLSAAPLAWVTCCGGVNNLALKRSNISYINMRISSPQVTWYKNTMQLHTTERHIMEKRGSRHTLLLRKVHSSDFSNYTCMAENSLGRTKRTVLLTGIPKTALFQSPPISQWGDR